MNPYMSMHITTLISTIRDSGAMVYDQTATYMARVLDPEPNKPAGARLQDIYMALMAVHSDEGYPKLDETLQTEVTLRGWMLESGEGQLAVMGRTQDWRPHSDSKPALEASEPLTL